MPKRVLIVEDEFAVALAMESLLLDAGYEVLGPVGSAAKALGLLEHERVDVAILDGNLRGRSVEPVADRLCSMGVPFLAVSGYAREQLGDWLEGAPLIGKPYADNRLLAEIERLRGGS